MFKQLTHPNPPAQITSNSNATNSVHFAAANLTIQISKIIKEKHVGLLHFRLSRQKRAKTHVNRIKQSRNKIIPGREGEEKFLLCTLTSFPGDATTPLTCKAVFDLASSYPTLQSSTSA